MSKAVRLAFLFLALTAATPAQSKFDVYYLAIGSQDYVQVPDPTVHSFNSIDGVRKSARAVADFFDAGGSRYGVVLLSTETGFVSIADVNTGLKKAALRAVEDKSANPLLVFYFAGHGISEGFGWNHFSVPGNFAYRGDPLTLPILSLAGSTIHTANVVDQLKKLKIPFLIILDNCYEGEEYKFDSPGLTFRLREGFKYNVEHLRPLNEFHNTYPVLFSTEPGTTVSISPDPRNPASQVEGVAPLARRLLIIKDAKSRRLTFRDLVALMMSPTLDPVTHPAVSHSLPVLKGGEVVWSPAARRGQHDEIFGTATEPVIIPKEEPQPVVLPKNVHVVVDGPAPPSWNATGTIRLAGKAGEYISDGRTYAFSSEQTPIEVMLAKAGGLELRIEGKPDSWEFRFRTGTGKPFQKRRYTASRFGDERHAAVEIVSPDHYCNETSGDLTVDEVAFDEKGTLSRFSAHFRQFCNNERQVLTGAVNLTLRLEDTLQAPGSAR
jgi:hypothetical protein